MIRNYSGTNWLGDWLEHFQRSLFFLHRFPANSPIVFGYQLSARPPAMNELAAFFLGQMHDRFELFQMIFAFLNLLIFLPSCLIMPALAGKRKTFVLPLAMLFLGNPAVMQQVTYAWTKALAAFFVVLALGFYLAGMRKNDPGRILAAFLSLSMGMLVHYSAGPYLLFLTAHYLCRMFWKRPASDRWREITVRFSRARCWLRGLRGLRQSMERIRPLLRTRVSPQAGNFMVDFWEKQQAILSTP